MGLNIPRGIYGVRGTTRENSIEWVASHGCIRMLRKNISELYNIVPVGTPVIARNGSFGPFGTGFRSLEPGGRGADVMAVQEKLKEVGYYKGGVSDIYGENLKNAIYRFQRDKNLRIKDTTTREDYNAMGLTGFEQSVCQGFGCVFHRFPMSRTRDDGQYTYILFPFLHSEITILVTGLIPATGDFLALISVYIDVCRLDAYNVHIEAYEYEETVWKAIRIIQRCLKRWEKSKK